MDALPLDPRVDIMAQTDGGQTGPVTVVALFHVPTKDAGKLLDAWSGEEAFIVRQPGSISRELLRGRAGSDVFLDIAKWETAAHYKAALIDPEHLALLAAYGPCGGSSALHLLDPTVKPVPLPPTVRDFIAAVNGADTEAMLSFFHADTGVIIDFGKSFVGHAAIRPWNDEWFIGAGVRVTVKSAIGIGNVVTVEADWKSAAYSGPSKLVFVLAEDHIVELRLGQ